MTDEDYQQQQDSEWGEVGEKMLKLQESMKYNLEDGRRGELIREGIKVAIIGKSCEGSCRMKRVFLLLQEIAHNFLVAIRTTQCGKVESL